MSRYILEAKEPEKYHVVVGWDRPLKTYYAQVWPKNASSDRDIVLWVGATHKEIPKVTQLAKAIEKYAVFDENMSHRLIKDGMLEVAESIAEILMWSVDWEDAKDELEDLMYELRAGMER